MGWRGGTPVFFPFSSPIISHLFEVLRNQVLCTFPLHRRENQKVKCLREVSQGRGRGQTLMNQEGEISLHMLGNKVAGALLHG